MRIRPIVLVLAIVTLAACTPEAPTPGPTGLYLSPQPDISPQVTPKATPVIWGWAPAIDANYGGTLYAGTSLQIDDPRPPLVNGDEPLRAWVADPADGRTDRPAILWFHGGGFALGIDSMYGLANGVGRKYATMGYVSISVEYRTDTTLAGTGTRPPSLCQWVQDFTGDPADATFVARKTQCFRNVNAAQFDALAAVRWVKANAATYGIDPNKVALGGFSAGAVTAYNANYQFDEVGPTTYFPGDVATAAASRPAGAIGASGFVATEDKLAPASIGAGDPPTSFIASRFDPAAEYGQSALTVNTARSRGLVAELTSYCSEGAHANNLYNEHVDATDRQWTTFLARELGLVGGLPPATDMATCPGI